jgi:hypothetical protein
MVPIIPNAWPAGGVVHGLCMQLLTVCFDMIVGDPYSIGGAALLGIRALVICSAVVMFGQGVKHIILEPRVIFGISEDCWSMEQIVRNGIVTWLCQPSSLHYFVPFRSRYFPYYLDNVRT